MSPTLFNVFINDLFDKGRHLGVPVPGIDEVIPGLLFADDTTALTATKEDMQLMLNTLGEWAANWGMSFGIAKCGVMVVGAGEEATEELRATPPTLNGQPLPVVDGYTYLGIPLNRKLDLDQVARERATKTAKLVGALRGTLQAADIPMVAKQTILKGVVLPTASYGGELLGMNESRVAPLQRQLDVSLRLVAGVRVSACSATVLATELGVPSVMAAMTGARGRGLKKFPTMHTWSGDLTSAESRLVHRQRTWCSGAWQWIQRFGSDEMREALSSEEVSEKTCAQLARRICSAREQNRARRNTISAREYFRRELDRTRDFVKRMPTGEPTESRNLAAGVRELVRLRTGARWNGYRAAQAGLISRRYLTHCPCCEKPTADTPAHFLLECEAWAEERKAFEADLPKQALRFLRRLADNSARLDWLLGGGVDGDNSAQALWLGRVDAETHLGVHAPERQKNNSLPPWAAVARFLQSTRRLYYSRLWRTSTLTVNRRPDGQGDS